MNNKLEQEYHKIKRYIVNPIEVGIWETTFKVKERKEASLFFYIKKFLNSSQLSLADEIKNILFYMYNVVHSIHNNYDFIEKDRKDFIKELIEKYKINIYNDSIVIDNEFFFIYSENLIYIKIFSLNKTLSENIEKILKEGEYASLEKREKRFSPKVILFQPYFFYTKIISHDLFYSSQEVLNYFNRALDLYMYGDRSNKGRYYKFMQNHEYEESIRMIGKAFESTLIHMYETLLRKDASHFSSIGKLLNSIKAEINDILEKKTKYTLKTVSTKISTICQKLEKNKEKETSKILNEFKNIAREIKEQLNNKNTDNVLFPNQIQQEIENVLKFRNQVSHHNTIQSTQEDVINMLFSYIQIYLWWQEASLSIKNWDGSKKEIIEEYEQLKKEMNIMKFNSFLEKPYNYSEKKKKILNFNSFSLFKWKNIKQP